MLCKNTTFTIYFLIGVGYSFNLFSDSVNTIKTIETEDTLICLVDQEKPSIIMGSINICPYCSSIRPIFEKLAQQYPHIQFVKVDGKKCNMHTTVERESHGKYKIIGYPAFIFVTNKEIKNMLLGGDHKALKNAIQEFDLLLKISNKHT